jgi:hypothetical protein
VPPEEVWHVLRLTNTGGLPWTTAPAMTMQEGRVLGQDILYYTAPGARTLLKITRAVDLSVDEQESELGREPHVRTRHGSSYDRITLKGELRIVNRRSRPITLLIKKTLSGDAVQGSPEVDVQTAAEGARYINPKRVLTWELPLPAGGKALVTYQYRAYVPG